MSIFQGCSLYKCPWWNRLGHNQCLCSQNMQKSKRPERTVS
jgi:hypothetical protein